MKNISGLILLTLFSIVCAIAIGEMWAKRFLPYRQNRIEQTFPVEFMRHPQPYTMFTGSANAVISAKEKLNALGYRGEAPQKIKSSGEIRVFVLGGSTIFAGDPPIPSILQELFQKNGCRNVKVYNFGVVSQASGQELARLVFEIADYQPDVVIDYNGANDITNPYIRDPRPGYPFNFIVYEHHPFLESNPDTYPLLPLILYQSRLMRYFAPDFFSEHLVPLEQTRIAVAYGSDSWKNEIANIYMHNLVKASKIAKTFKADFLVFFQPQVFYKDRLSDSEKNILNYWQPADRDYYLEMRQRILSLANFEKTASNLTFFDLSDFFDQTSESIFTDVMHPNQHGIEVMARHIYQSLVQSVDVLKCQSIG